VPAVVGCHRQAEVMATVNGYAILRPELDRVYARHSADAPRPLTAFEADTLRLALLHTLIVERLQLQRAVRLGITVSSRELTARLNQQKEPYTAQEFQHRLEELGMTEGDLTEAVRRQLTIDKLVNQEIGSRVTITDAEILSYYDQNKSAFSVAEPQYHLGHIDAGSLNTIRQARAALDSGADFDSVAARYSEGTGTIASVPESQIQHADAVTRDAILKLAPGHYTNPLPIVDDKTHQRTGYRIIELAGKADAGQRDLMDPVVQQWIRNELRQEHEHLLRAAFDEALYNGADVHNYLAERVLTGAASR
jgi:peptidyl-prolyl cis-trans isomerase SurA